jgi:hypothetical protein
MLSASREGGAGGGARLNKTLKKGGGENVPYETKCSHAHRLEIRVPEIMRIRT